MDDVRPHAGSRRAYWTCQLVGWGSYAVFTTWQLTSEQAPLGRAIVEPLFAGALGVGLTHAFRSLVRRRGWTDLGLRPLAPRVVAASIGLALAFLAVLLVVERFVYADRPSAAEVLEAVLRWTRNFFVWTALYFGTHLLLQRQRGEIERLELAQALQSAELRALKSQLNPHFLFNALNAVRALIADDPERAQRAVTQLAKILRYSLGAGEEDWVAFRRELEIVDDYLGLESLRLGERLRIERDVSDAAAGARMPVMLLQTLVENAVKHGIAQLPEGGTLGLSARVEDGALVLRIENPRPERADASQPGIGIANASSRLRLLFGEGASLTLDLSQAGRAAALVRIPQPS
jgi:hypothetical protein